MRMLRLVRLVPVAVMVGLSLHVMNLARGLYGSGQTHLRIPIPENEPNTQQTAVQEGPAYGRLLRMDGRPSQIQGDWPQFRGPNRDGIYLDPGTSLATHWPASGPKVLWRADLGEGYAGAAIHNGRVYVLDYDQADLADAMRCLSLDDGREIWRYSYPVKVKRNHGMSRTVPAVCGGFVVGLGPKCHVVCLDANDGTFKWGLDLVKELGATVPQWYAGQCPLIYQGRVILGVGGADLMVAVDLASGQIVWRTANPSGWKMTHSSVMPMQLDKVTMFVWCTSGGVVGVSAEDGRLLWSYPDWKITIANVPSPVVARQGRLFLSGGYNSGALMLQLTQAGDGIDVQPEYRLRPEVFGSPQHTPILYDGHLYGVRPDGQMACLSLDGQVIWTSGPGYRFGLGPYMVANGLLLAMDDEGLLTIARAQPSGFQALAQAKVLQGHESWAPMAIVSGRLIARDLTSMVCLDISGQ